MDIFNIGMVQYFQVYSPAYYEYFSFLYLNDTIFHAIFLLFDNYRTNLFREGIA